MVSASSDTFTPRHLAHSHGLWIANFEEIEVLRLDLDHLAFGQDRAREADRIALVELEGLHHLRCAGAVVGRQRAANRPGSGKGANNAPSTADTRAPRLR